MKNKPTFRLAAVCGCVISLVTTSNILFAQSGAVTRGSGSVVQGGGVQGSMMQGSVTQGSAMQGSQGSGMTAEVAMNGYCPVCIIDMRKWVKGNLRYAVLMDGKKYLFPGEAQKQKFLANTTKYTPALNGNCVVCYAEGGGMVEGSVYHTAVHRERLYMFPSGKEHALFMREPTKYENLDLAFGGMCAVCRVEMQQQIPGKAEFGTIHAGKRYYFPGQEQKMMFLGNKAKYAEK